MSMLNLQSKGNTADFGDVTVNRQNLGGVELVGIKR